MTISAAQKNGFTVKSSKDIAEIDGTGWLLTHDYSGAKLMFLECDDNNKSFAITFKTPPKDNTGVFHILEHSVLCGSKRYPVKEPFVNLVKSSMQTFLNAMTFPDKTMYPASSTNEKDLQNIMNVYFDAVFNPSITQNKARFLQEGWHYEIKDKSPLNDAEALDHDIKHEDISNKQLEINGVVYNEMKGVYSDPESVLNQAIMNGLFPDTTYGFESGGHPQFISDLTYEDYIDEYDRHYCPDNCYIILYGNLDIDKTLSLINENYLSVDYGRKSNPNPLELQKPVKNHDIVCEMCTSQTNEMLACGYVIGCAADTQMITASDILLDILMGSNEAPLKKALLESDLIDDASAYMSEAHIQPTIVINIKGANISNEKGEEILTEAIRKILKDGIDRDRIEASLANYEFLLHERDFGTPDGILYSMNAMAGWLYSEKCAFSHLEYKSTFQFLRDSVKHNFFENLMKDIFLENNHTAVARIKPVKSLSNYNEADELALRLSQFTEADFKQISDETMELTAFQNKVDTEDEIASLPTLSLEDLAQIPPEHVPEVVDDFYVTKLFHAIPTNEISYLITYFDMSYINYDDLKYASLLAPLLGKLSTKSFSAEELDLLISLKLGKLHYFTEVFTDSEDPDRITPYSVAFISCLSKNIDYAIDLGYEVFASTKFNDKDKIKKILTQRKVHMEQAFISAGHSASMLRCRSYINKAAMLSEQLGGVDFYKFLCEVLENFDKDYDTIFQRMNDVKEKIFNIDNCMISFTGKKEDSIEFDEKMRFRGRTPHPAHNITERIVIPDPEPKNEAFVVPSNVCYSAASYMSLGEFKFEGSWMLATSAMNYDYLWNEVRVKGGAYGCGFKANRMGNFQFYSYRDPKLDETIERYRKTGAWLSTAPITEAELLGYKISCVGSIDSPVKPKEIAHRTDADIISRLPKDYRKIQRTEAIEATVDTLHKHGEALRAINDNDIRCVFGSKEIIEGSKLDWNVVNLF